MALVRYGRVSSVGLRLDVQLDELKQCDKIYQEKKSGASGKRPKIKACLEHVREGDTLVVARLDRLARSTLHLCQIENELERKRVHLQVLDQNIDTSDATGRLLFNMLGAIAQFETEIRAERQMDVEQRSAYEEEFSTRCFPMIPRFHTASADLRHSRPRSRGLSYDPVTDPDPWNIPIRRFGQKYPLWIGHAYWPISPGHNQKLTQR